MFVTQKVREILNNYESDCPGVKMNLARILMSGSLAGTGKMVILPVDQGVEHGPDRSFLSNEDCYDPHYLAKLTKAGGFNAFASNIGVLESIAGSFAGDFPMILKINSSNLLYPSNCAPYQALNASVKDALRLGCCAIGLTIYPGSSRSLDTIKELSEIIREAKSYGLAVVIWSYARGEDIAKEDETAIDVINYSAHIAASLGANIIKVKPPKTSFSKIEGLNGKVEKLYKEKNISIDKLENRIAMVKKSCFNGRKLVIFSGGDFKDEISMLEEIKNINAGGGDGSIVGRNIFQREFNQAISLSEKICDIYKKN